MTTKYIIASGLAGLMLAAPAALVLAHEDGGADASVKADAGLHLGEILKAQFGGDVRKDADNDGDVDKADVKANVAALRSHVTAGVVTSVNGSGFVIDPVGKKSTTTISTNSSTVFKAKGGATSSAAVQVGSRVFVVGTTTATSSNGDSFSASLVALIGKGLGHLKFWHWFR